MNTEEELQENILIQHFYQCNQFLDAIEEIKIIIKKKPRLDPTIRFYLIKSFKQLFLERRECLQILHEAIKVEEENDNMEIVGRLYALCEQQFKDIQNYFNDFSSLVNGTLLLHIPDDFKTKFLYIKTLADFSRYACEYATGITKKITTDLCIKNYTNALELADAHFNVQTVEYLAFALNYSIFLYEIKEDKNAAISYCSDILRKVKVFYDIGSTSTKFEMYYQMIQD